MSSMTESRAIYSRTDTETALRRNVLLFSGQEVDPISLPFVEVQRINNLEVILREEC